MIEEIKIESFFSFGEKQTITLNAGANILIGINGSGKSNFIKTIQLLFEGVAGKDGLEDLINKRWGGFTGIANCTPENVVSIKISYEFDRQIIKSALNGEGYDFTTDPVYEIEIQKSGLANYYFHECIYKKKKGKSPSVIYLQTKGQGFILDKENKNIEIKQGLFKQNELVLRQISEPDRFYPLYTLKKAIEQITAYNHFDTSPNSLVRQLSPYYSELKLLPNGENLTHLLNYLNGNHAFQYDKIIGLLSNANPNFRGLVFSVPTGGKTLLALKEENLHRAITIEHISDGTLRFLLLLSILYNPNRGKTVCLDEPETGLHPDMINTVCEGIKYAAKNGTQMIVATHSPLLLNSFDLEDLRVFEKSESNSTSVKSIGEKDFPGWEGEFLVGQMWLRGQIGGVRW